MSRHTFRQWIFAVRPWSFPASAMPIIVTLAYLFWKGAEINWLYGLWALVNMVLFHTAGNLWSDWIDFRKGVDSAENHEPKALTTGCFQPKEIRNLAIGVLAVSVAGGLGLVVLTGLPLLWIGIAGAVLTVVYPMMKYNALGDLDILLTFALLPTVGTAYITTGVLDWSVLWIAVPVGLITDGILHANNTRDMVSDRKSKINTMAMSMGRMMAAKFYSFEVIFPFVWLAACSIAGLMPFQTVFTFITLPVALGCARTMIKSANCGSDIIGDLDARTANLQFLFSLILSVTFVASKFIA